MSQTEKQKLGQWGEERASLFLIENDYEIVERNFRIKEGEIDIIAWHKDEHDKLRKLSFIEVKTRSYGDGSAERAVDEEKMKKFYKACKCYCFERGIDIGYTSIMFEQISVYVEQFPDKFEIRKYVIPID